MLVARVGAFVRLGRPHFLAGGFLMHGLGVIMALYQGATLSWPAFWWGQLAITAGQWMTQYGNEFYDLPADRLTITPTRWSGGSRVLPAGQLRPAVALLAAFVLAVLALGATLVLAWTIRPGPLTLLLPALAILLAWSYSAPPLRLHSRGLGELTTALVVPGLTPLLGFYLQRGQLDWWVVPALWPLGCLQFAMLLAIEFPDAAGDALAGKDTLVVRMGDRRAAHLYIATLLAAYGPLPFLVWQGLPPRVALGICLGTPVALWLGWRVKKGDWAQPDRQEGLAFGSISLLLGTALVEQLMFWSLLL